MEFSGYGATDVGRVRERNEDAYLVDDSLGLFAVADGLGGHAAGEVASRMALDRLATAVEERRGIVEATAADDDHSRLLRVLVRAGEQSAAAVYEAAQNDHKLVGMGTTLTALLCSGPRAVMVHAGDSQLHLHRDGRTEQLSTDHSMAWEVYRRGEATWSEARSGRYSHVLTRCLGTQSDVRLETLRLDVLPDDQFLLCTDGLIRHVPEPVELSGCVAAHPPEALPDQLVRLATGRGGEDNVTVVVTQARGTAEESAALLTLGEQRRHELALLRQIPPFAEIPFVHLLRLRRRAHVIEFAPGETVLERGGACVALVLILEGAVRVVPESGGAVELGVGEVFGAASLLAPYPARATITAPRGARTLALPRETFLPLTRRRPWLGVELLTGLAEWCTATRMPV